MLKSELFPAESTVTPANAPKRIRGSSLKDKILSQRAAEPAKPSTPPATPAKATQPAKAKQPSAPVDAFLVSADGRVKNTKISLDLAPVIKAYGIVIVPADSSSMLTFQIQKQYTENVTLAAMLRDKNFKAAYNAAK